MNSRTLPCLAAFLFHLLISSGPNAVQSQGDTPVIHPTTLGGTTTTPTVNPPSTPAVPQAGPTTTPTGSRGVGQWCIASSTAAPTALQVALDYACGYGGADCSAIQPGASCYEPNTVRDHASYAFNDYYQKHPGPTSCVFGGTAQLTNTDPSNGNCHHTPASTSNSISAPSPPSPAAYTTPTITTPTTTVPGGGLYGVEEPTGLPSSAASLPRCIFLIFATAGILLPLLSGNYFQADGN